MNYTDFLKAKIKVSQSFGFDIPESFIPENCLPHQPEIIKWSLKQGRCLLGLQFGLGKTFIQCAIMKAIDLNERICKYKHGKKFLFVCPLGVKHQFTTEDGPRLDMVIKYCRNDQEVNDSVTPYIITNYERVRDGNITIDDRFIAITLDEGSVLRSLGTQTTQKFIQDCQYIPYRFVSTATPAPNEYLEIINYAEFLGIMDRGQALTRWFKRDSLKAGNLTIHPQHEKDFWLWVSTWAIFLSKPSELGYSDAGYELPGIEINWHCVDFDETKLGLSVDEVGQIKAFTDAAAGISALAKIKKATIGAKIEHAGAIVNVAPDQHYLLWHLMEYERQEIENAFPDAVSVYGSQSIEEKERRIMDFAHGKLKKLATKPEIAGSGCNFQYHCHRAIYLSIDYRFQDFIQSIYRIYRYLQANKVNIDIIYTRQEEPIVTALKKKWKQHEELLLIQSRLIKEFGLSHSDRLQQLQRSIGVKRQVHAGEGYTLVNNDSVEEIARMESDSVGLELTSIPFGNHYEYTHLYNDFGHNDDDNAFFRQMDFLIAEKFRVLMPGRICVVHVKDRILYGHQTGLQFPTVNPFSDKTVAAYTKHGFAFMGRITISTDVVRENAQTYRLGWTEMCKDGSKMGVGSPEYLLIFRKPVPGALNGYAAEPVFKEKIHYTRGRWQIDAHAIWKSNGNRLLTPDEYAALEPGRVFKTWKQEAENSPYDYERHVAICEALDQAGRLSASFMMLPTPGDPAYIWDDVNYMHGLNMEQSRRKQENHICPLPYDIVDRCIERWSNPGDLVADFFDGLGTTVYRSVMKGRRGFGCELNEEYWRCSVRYLKEYEAKKNVPTLF